MRKIDSKGYSFIELIVYISVFVLISIVVTQSLLYSMKTYSVARSYRALQRNADTALDRITREVRNASSITTGSSTFGSSPGTLSFSGTDSTNTPYSGSLSVLNGNISLVLNGNTYDLTSNEVSISDITFWSITTNTSDAVKIKITLSTTRAPIITKSFYTTVVLRE